MNTAISLEKKQQDKSSVTYKSIPRKQNPAAVQPTISGTVTEIGNGYMIVDNTALCRNPKAGKEYKVYTDDIRVKRWSESGEIKTGDLVAVEYEGKISGSCEITGAYSIFTGTLEENDILTQ